METLKTGEFIVDLFDEATGKSAQVVLIVQNTGVFISLRKDGEEMACVGAEVWNGKFRSLNWKYDENYMQEDPEVIELAEVKGE